MTHKGAVAAGHEVTAAAAFELLEDGGNAFDAAIAGVLAACVAEPILASPGGGGFMTARKGDAGRGNPTRVFDFFAQTPRRKRVSANTLSSSLPSRRSWIWVSKMSISRLSASGMLPASRSFHAWAAVLTDCLLCR